MGSNLKEYVDIDQLNIWKAKLSGINNTCIGYLNDFEKKALELQSVWGGVAAGCFDENFQKQLNTAKEHHDELTDVNEFIETLAETVLNQ